MSFKKICALAALVPLAAVLIAFMVANRGGVTVRFNIFAALLGRTGSGAVLTLPLFVWLFLSLALGAALGGAAQWLRRLRLQKELSALKRENARLSAAKTASPARNADDAFHF